MGTRAPLAPPRQTRITHSDLSGSAASLNSDWQSESRLAALRRIAASQIPIPSAQYAVVQQARGFLTRRTNFSTDLSESARPVRQTCETESWTPRSDTAITQKHGEAS
jgi:hypothetical protein